MANQASFFKMGGAIEFLEFQYTPVIGISQFVFAVFGGSASVPSLRIDWGDGTIENIVAPNQGSNIYHTYATTDEATVKIRGINGKMLSDISRFTLSSGGSFTDHLDLSSLSNLEVVSFSSNALVTELTLLSSYMTDIFVTSNAILTTINANVTEFNNVNTINKGISIFSNPSLTDFNVNSDILFSGTPRVHIYNNAINNFTGFTNPANVISQAYMLNNDMPLSAFSFTNITEFIYVQDNGMSAANVDAFINSVEASATLNNVQNKTLRIDGTNAAPTAASATAISNLVALGWTVTTS